MSQLCKDLLALWLVEPDGSGQYACAVSFYAAVLEEMLVKEVDEESRFLYKIEPIRLYVYAIEIDREGNSGPKRVLFYNAKKDFNEIHWPLYASYLLDTDKQILVAREPPSEDDETFSAVPIQLDVFYDEGIMNAC